MKIIPPTQALPHKGGGRSGQIPPFTPSPSEGEGWGEGDLRTLRAGHSKQ